MDRYLVVLPAPEVEWALLPEAEHEKGMLSHAQFHSDLEDGGHELLVANPLEPSSQATAMRPDGSGGVIVTEGPFTDSAEQIVGFYLIQTDDESDLRAACERFAGRGEHIEFRRLAE